jgi:hypothetical protein
MKNEINAFKMYLNSIINEIPVEIHEELWNNLVNVSCAYQKILNGEIRESCKEFCQCSNPQQETLTNGDVKCVLCGKLTWQNSLERT